MLTELEQNYLKYLGFTFHQDGDLEWGDLVASSLNDPRVAVVKESFLRKILDLGFIDSDAFWEEINAKSLILLRGLPGAGKTTLAKTIALLNQEEDSATEICADYFFTDDYDGYHFDPDRLEQAHEWCLGQVEAYMTYHQVRTIVVHNTFTTESELTPYFQIADQYGYRVFSAIVENRHGGRNTHAVPAEKIQQFRERFEISL